MTLARNFRYYVVKIRTPRRMVDLMRGLEPLGDVLSFRELADPSDPLEPPTGGSTASSRLDALGLAAVAAERRKRPASPELIEARRKAAETRILQRKNEVYVVLSEILRKNQHAPLEKIIRELNASDVRPLRNGPWRGANIQSYLDYTLQKMTEPVTGSAETGTKAKPVTIDNLADLGDALEKLN